jgi:hypothetical protein
VQALALVLAAQRSDSAAQPAAARPHFPRHGRRTIFSFSSIKLKRRRPSRLIWVQHPSLAAQLLAQISSTATAIASSVLFPPRAHTTQLSSRCSNCFSAPINGSRKSRRWWWPKHRQEQQGRGMSWGWRYALAQRRCVVGPLPCAAHRWGGGEEKRAVGGTECLIA